MRLTTWTPSAFILVCGVRLAAAEAPAPYDVTPELVENAKKEGKVVWYSSIDVAVAEKLAGLFETRYPDINVQVERSGAERIFQRIFQEYGSNIRNVDVIETSDAVHFVLVVSSAVELIANSLPVLGGGARPVMDR